jgi:hypothetical protein
LASKFPARSLRREFKFPAYPSRHLSASPPKRLI